MNLVGVGCKLCDLGKNVCGDCKFLERHPLARKKTNILYAKFKRNYFASCSISELNYIYDNGILWPTSREEERNLLCYVNEYTLTLLREALLGLFYCSQQ